MGDTPIIIKPPSIVRQAYPPNFSPKLNYRPIGPQDPAKINVGYNHLANQSPPRYPNIPSPPTQGGDIYKYRPEQSLIPGGNDLHYTPYSEPSITSPSLTSPSLQPQPSRTQKTKPKSKPKARAASHIRIYAPEGDYDDQFQDEAPSQQDSPTHSHAPSRSKSHVPTHAPTISQKRAFSAKAAKRLRDRNIRNPEEPIGLKSDIFRNIRLRNKSSRHDSKDWDPDAEDDDFYRSMRQEGIQRQKETRRLPKPESVHTECTKLKGIASDAIDTKNILTACKHKITNLEENLREQDDAMRELLQQNEDLEKRVATLARQEMTRLTSGNSSLDSSIQSVIDQNKALETEVERLKLQRADKKIFQERKNFRHREKELEQALSAARKENNRLLDEINDKRKTSNSSSEGQESKRKEAQLKRALTSAKNENADLIKEIRSRNLEFEKIERQRGRQEEEIKHLSSELEMNRRIVHTKRDIIQKEMTEETRDRMRDEMEKQLTIELTNKISKDLNTVLREEKERDLKELREKDEGRVREAERKVPELEREVDRLRRELSNEKEDHERDVRNIKSQYKNKIDALVNNFSHDREREEFDFIKRVDFLSMENERNKERATKEKEAYGAQIREEVTKDMQNEIKFLADRVTELTKESIGVVEKMTKEKILYGDIIREDMEKEMERALEKAAREKESHAEQIRQETIEERDQEFKSIKSELEDIIKEKEMLQEKLNDDNEKIILKKDLEKHVTHVGELLAERDAMLKRINEAESNLQLTKENFQSDVKELHGTKSELESSKEQIAKLKAQRNELTMMAEEFKNDCESMASEVRKIKSHFKFSVLVEYEEKIIELENEVERLESILSKSEAYTSQGGKMILEQSSQLEQYESKEQSQSSEVKRLSNELKSAVLELESKELRLSELKDVMQKKETELSRLNENVKNLNRSLGISEKKLAAIQNEQEISKQRMISIQVYKDKVSLLNTEINRLKSRVEHCRCDGTPYDQTGQNISNPEDAERIQRLSVMLRVAEKNLEKERLGFELTRERLDRILNERKDEIESLYSEIERLKKLLNRSQKDLRGSLEREAWQIQLTQDAHSSQTILDATQQKELLHKIEEAEKVVDDAKQYRSESENVIQSLRDALSLQTEEKRKVAQELRDSKLLFREAVMSWRVETRNLKKQLDQSRSLQNHPDGISDAIAVTTKLQQSLQIIAEDGESLPPHSSLNFSDIDSDSSWSREESSRSQHRSTSPALDSNVETGICEKRDDVIESSMRKNSPDSVKDISEPLDGSHEKRNAPPERFTKILDISEHTASVEMKYDNEKDGESEDINAASIFDSLKEFNNEFKQYLHRNNFADMITKNIGNAPAAEESIEMEQIDFREENSEASKTEDKGLDVREEKDQTSKLPHAPTRAHLNDKARQGDQSKRDLSNNSGNSSLEQVTRDDNMKKTQVHQKRLNIDNSLEHLREQSPQNVIPSTESGDSGSKDISEGSGRSNVSERSRILRKKMSELLEIKNDIKMRSNASFSTEEKYNNLRPKNQQRGDVSTTRTAKTFGTPWGKVSGKKPKIYKFLKAKTSSPEKYRRGQGVLAAAPTDEEHSKHSMQSWRE